MTRRGVLIWLGAIVDWTLLLFSYRYLDDVLSGDEVSVLAKLIEEGSGALAAGLLFFPTRALVRRLPLARGLWGRRLPLYVAALFVFAGVHTSLMWAQREALFPVAGLGNYDYGRMPLRYAMELPMQAIGFVVMVAVLHGVAALRRAREREVREAQLAESLARAELRSLRLQLQPHFLFNALNTISSTMYTDPAAADEMLDRLAELLRASLRTTQTDEVPLAEEIKVLDCYLDLMRARFGERLQVTTHIAPGTGPALVPSMILQPLVENAVRHGNVEHLGRGSVEVRARCNDGRLEIEVEDDGPGLPEGADPLGSGLGLSATAERLALLYGEAQRFEIGNGENGGCRVRAVFPYRTTEGTA